MPPLQGPLWPGLHQQRRAASARAPGERRTLRTSRGATLRYTPSLARSCISQSVSSHGSGAAAITSSTEAKSMRRRYHLPSSIVSLGFHMPLTSTKTVVASTGRPCGSRQRSPMPQYSMRELAAPVPVAARGKRMSTRLKTMSFSGISATSGGKPPSSSSTMRAPWRPPPACTAVPWWWCGWYQCVPGMWFSGICNLILSDSPGAASSKT
mmetsp:Transcript_11156/g.34880  ORF Transcript_11156/g.34880 Transcript_11156/m.34880 type:complete len:210 (+) Transcript_11156:979-1608(+)